MKTLVMQLAVSIGMLNAGHMAQEQTHYVRMSARGYDTYLSVAGDVGRFRARLLHMPTQLVVWKCEQNCGKLSRWTHEPPQEAHSEGFSFTMAALGYRVKSASVGLTANVVHGARPQFWGATPMTVFGGWLDARAGPLEIGMSIIPPQPARWVVLDELGGGKINGQDYTNPQRFIVLLHAGLLVNLK